MKYFLSALLYLSLCCQAAPFPDLIKKELKFSWPEAAAKNENQKYYFSYNKKYFTEINRTLGSLPKTDPLYTEEAGSEDILVGVVDISGAGDLYYVVLGFGPSYDLSYIFYGLEKVKNFTTSPENYVEPDFEIYATSLVIPSNGNVYGYGHNNNLYNIKRKYVYANGKIAEFPQQFFYVGKKAISLKDQTIYSDLTLTNELFKISKGSSITVVGIQPLKGSSSEILYLIASEFGLVGFVKAEVSQEQNQFSGFYWNGD